MAKRTIRVSDRSGQEIEDGGGATIRITFDDPTLPSRVLDVTKAEAESLGGQEVPRRGRKPRATA